MDRVETTKVDEKQCDSPIQLNCSDVYGSCGKGPATNHTVTSGETLYGIAKDNIGATDASDFMIKSYAKQIAETNKIAHPSKIYAGEKLSVPKPCDPCDKTPDGDKPNKPTESLDHVSDRLSNIFKTSNNAGDAAKLLANELEPRLNSLDTKDREYNYLIEKLYNKLPDDQGIGLAATGWNNETHTWNKLIVTDQNYPVSPPVRIVQPGNTIDDIVDDRIKELQSQGKFVNPDAYKNKFMDENLLDNDKDLARLVARPVYLPR